MDEEEKDLYDILGVKKGATKDEIKSAYKDKAKQLHPDMEGGDEEKFKELQEAYDVLMDDDLRVFYDNTGEKEKVDFTERIISFLQSKVIIKITSANSFIRIDLIKRIHQDIDATETIYKNSIETAEQSIEKIKFVTKRLRLKEGENVEDLFGEMLNEKLGDLESEIKFCHLELTFIEALRNFVDKYEYIIEDLIEPTKKSRYGYISTRKVGNEDDEEKS